MSASVGEQLTPATAVGGELLVAEAHAAAFAAAGLERLDDLFNLSGTERLDKPSLPSWRQRIRFELPGGPTLYLKRYASPPVRVQLRRILSGQGRRSLARLEWERMAWLAGAGIDAVRPVALGEEMTGLWERRSAVVTAAVPGESLERHVGRCPQRASRALIRSLAAFVARFHRAGYIHRDLYLSHVFLDVRGGQPWFCLIDLGRLFRPRRRRRRWIVKELASLDYSTPRQTATATDRLRFVRDYLGLDRLGPGPRRLVRRVARKTRLIARHDNRRLQPERARL